MLLHVSLTESEYDDFSEGKKTDESEIFWMVRKYDDALATAPQYAKNLTTECFLMLIPPSLIGSEI